MVLKKSIVIILTIFGLLTMSCKDVTKEIESLTKEESISTVKGTTHYLNDDGIRILLPDAFKRFSAAEYEAVVNKVLPKKDQKPELDRFRTLRNMDGNFYIFFDEKSYSTYTANAIPYKPISRKDATNLLALIRENQEKAMENRKVEITKLTAKYNDNGLTQIFKAIFKIKDLKSSSESYQTAYFISSNDKTVLIQLSTPNQIDFDPYLQQMVF